MSKRIIQLIILLFAVFISCDIVLAAGSSPDAIAIRVIPNPNHYGAMRWYKEQGFAGQAGSSPQSLLIDGYEAIRDGRTVYVNAANVDTVNSKLYTNIYLISYNQDAEQATVDILNRILEHWKFNENISGAGDCVKPDKSHGDACLRDSDCPGSQYCSSKKAEITRDTRRLADLAEIKIALSDYRGKNNKYPALSSGSYLPNKTISTWPSWQETLARELKSGLANDPINKLGDCAGFDQTTCWNELTKKFADSDLADPKLNLPASSHVYVYSAKNNGANYDLCAVMESGLITGLDHGACAESAKTAQINQANANNPPVITDASLPTAYLNKPYQGFVKAFDPDNDPISWTFTIVNCPNWTNFKMENTIIASQKKISAANAGQITTCQINITVKDNRGGMDSKNYAIVGAPAPCVLTCSALGQPNCQDNAHAPANAQAALGVCCGAGQACYQCQAGFTWNGTNCAALVCVPNGCNGNCPVGCAAAQDPDCSAVGCCGNNVVNAGENCCNCPGDVSCFAGASCQSNGVCLSSLVIEMFDDTAYKDGAKTTAEWSGDGEVRLPAVTSFVGKTFGGVNGDYVFSVQQTVDGGYILAGKTNSFGAGGDDAWLIKTDSGGVKQWEGFFGGPTDDTANSVRQTSDSGYILGGYVSGASIDARLIKRTNLNGQGWSNNFGGVGSDNIYSVWQTSDGGYILAGHTTSFGAGHKDFWLVKTDSSGNQTWDKTFGGASDDDANSVQQTSDGGYILAGQTASFGAGGGDAWLIKTDSSGNQTWNKTFGGAGSDYTLSVQQTADGGYILAGYTSSFGAGNLDFWLVKTDSLGNKTWDKTFGGASSDAAHSVQQTADGGYILAGETESFGAGNYDFWLVKTDSLGNKTWDKTFGGASSDAAHSVQQTADGGYILAGYTFSFGAGSGDAWLIKTNSLGNAEWSTNTYSSPATAQSKTLDNTADTITKATLIIDQQFNGQTITHYLSANGGSNWEPVNLGVEHSFTNTGSDLRWKAVLTTTDPAKTPIIKGYNLTYEWNSGCGACSATCTAPGQPDCQASAPVDSQAGAGTCCNGKSCYQCLAGYVWDGSQCKFPCPFSLIEKWHWDGSGAAEPNYNQVMMTPVVADLDGDGVSEIIFNTFDTASAWVPLHTEGILRAVDGQSGALKFSVTNSSYRVNAGAGIAVGDIDNDGKMEIVTGKRTGSLPNNDNYKGVIAFEHNGAYKWSNDGIYIGAVGSPSIADLDNDGTPEVIIGNVVLNGNDGSVRWIGAGSVGGYVSAVADIDMDGKPEVVTGCTAYHFNGAIYWDICGSYPDGYVAIGNFDADSFPEIVVVSPSQNKIRMHEHTGALKWESAIPFISHNFGGGPPTIADFDNDGSPEIGVASADYYVVFESDGTVKWKQANQDFSSARTGSSVFDFNNDGEAEVLYSDEQNFRIYQGSTGAVLLEMPNSSGTLIEYPVVADVNNDNQPEIVIAANDYAFGSNKGIRIFRNNNPNPICAWTKTRKIWNQHSYHVTNINDDGTIPQIEQNNWGIYNNYRQNIKLP